MAVLRVTTVERLLDVAAALVAGGVRSLEVTLRTDAALDGIARLAAHHGADVAVGAGTVTDADQADAAIAAGAGYLVSPGLALDVLERGLEHGVPVIPGVLTPTEAMAARAAGATIAKLFPAAALGPGYIRDVLGPLPDLRLLATGGIAIDDAPAYLAAGAVAVGLGTPLVGDADAGGDLEALEARARRLTELVTARRAEPALR